MNITFENPDHINGKMTLTVEETDFKERVEKKLKDYRRRANVPGFRQGHAPMQYIQKVYGMSVKMEEINHVVNDAIYGYMKDNKIGMLGSPMPAEEQKEQDLEGTAPYTFVFDIAVAPEISIKLSKHDQVPMYHISVDDKLIDQQAEQHRRQFGHYEKAEQYDAEKQDILRGTLTELDADGNEKEEGIRLEETMLMPKYFNEQSQADIFSTAKPGETLTFNPRKAYQDNDSEVAALLKKKKEEVADITADFHFNVTEVSRFTPAELGTELYDKLFQPGTVKTEEEFRAQIAAQIAAQLEQDAHYRFGIDLRKHLTKKAGNIILPEELLKRFMKENNKDKGDDYVEQNFKGSIEALKWQLIKDQLIDTYEVKIENDDVLNVARDTARQQFAQYGMQNVPEEYINKYADDMLKKEDFMRNCIDRAAEQRLFDKLKTVVKVVDKDINLDDFNKLFEEK